MNKPTITLDPALFDTWPHITLGCLFFEANVKEPDELFWQDMSYTYLPELAARIEETELVKWEGIYSSREIYKAFGRSPSRYRVSSESLLRRVKKREELYRVNTVVDTNNLVSMETGLSLGSFDLEKIQGNIVFRAAKEGEGYEGIGKNYINMEKMLILADEKGPFGSTTSDSQRCMVTSGRKRPILTVMYCFSDKMDMADLTHRAAETFEMYAGALDLHAFLVTKNGEIDLDA